MYGLVKTLKPMAEEIKLVGNALTFIIYTRVTLDGLQ